MLCEESNYHNRGYDKCKRGVQSHWYILFSFFGTLIRSAIHSVLLSIGYGGVRYFLYLMSFADKPTWWNVIGYAVGLWSIIVLYGLFSVAIIAFLAYKDPVFKEVHKKLVSVGKIIGD